jgi:mono/diheme cytochrome c family protein
MRVTAPWNKILVAGLAVIGVVVCSASATDPAEPPRSDLAAFKKSVLPVLHQSCIKCHGSEKPKGGFRIDALNPDLQTGADGEKWEEVLNQVNIGSMPPKGEKPLAAAEREAITGWLNREMQAAADARASTGGRGVIRRLTRYEYNYTLQDLLDLPTNHVKNMPEDRAGADGLRNNSSLLGMSPSQFEMYLETASVALRKAMIASEKPKIFRLHDEVESDRSKGRPPGFDKAPKATPAKDGVSMPPGAFHPITLGSPREGRFKARVRVGGSPGPDGQLPRLQLWLGYQATGRVTAREMVGEATVRASLEQPEVIEFDGFMEDYPVPFGEGKGSQKPIQAFLIHAVHGDEVAPEGESPPQNADRKQLLYVDWMEFEIPYFKSWPPRSRTIVVGDSESVEAPSKRARSALASFASRAWRRPVQVAEIEPAAKSFDAFYKSSKNFDDSMRDAAAILLASPKFLYLVEPAKESRRQLNAHELASRLSYFLWCSLPDAQLRELADTGALLKDDVLAAQVRRMLEDPKARRFAQHFTEQWLGVDLIDRVAVNPEHFPRFKNETKIAMRQEPIEFFWHVLSKDKSSLDFLSCDYVLVNDELAKHYGLKGVFGPAFRPVRVQPQDHRGGLLTMACFMLAHSNGADSHPIFRGKWLLKDILNDPPPPPPPGVPELNQADKKFAKLPLKRQLEIHREQAACASCHNKLDPWGLALENFDAIGQWRTSTSAAAPQAKNDVVDAKNKKKKKAAPKVVQDQHPIDAAVKLPDGTAIDGVDELKRYCLEKKSEEFSRALVRKLMAYALGRSLEWTDRPSVDSLSRQFAQSDYRLRSLIEEIVLSKNFRTR